MAAPGSAPLAVWTGEVSELGVAVELQGLHGHESRELVMDTLMASVRGNRGAGAVDGVGESEVFRESEVGHGRFGFGGCGCILSVVSSVVSQMRSRTLWTSSSRNLGVSWFG